MVRFLVELSRRHAAKISPTPSNSASRTLPFADTAGKPTPTGVYEIDISPPPENSYWLDWGGHFDQFIGKNIELYYSRFLDRVSGKDILTSSPFSYYIDPDNHMVFLNVPMHPWLYPDHSAEAEHVIPFLSAALDPGNPSNNKIQGVTAKTLLEIPNFTIKLSDSVSGVILNQGFNLNFINNDGYFDDEGEWDLFNTPVTLKKSMKENPAYGDFRQIRRGLADSTSTSFDTFAISVSDKMKNMEEPVCKVIQQADYPDLAVIPGAIGKNIPVVYGKKRVDLIKISDKPERYIAAEFISSIAGIYDRDGNSLPCPSPLPDGTIDVSGAASAVITGYTSNKIGEIIRDIIGRKTAMQYHDDNWNTAETERYIKTAPKINIAFNSGNVREAVQAVLKSDVAYLIQQSDGRFTIRRHGEDYGSHKMPAWAITQKPEKNYNKACDNYFSSCVINYDFADKDTFKSYLFEEMKNEAEDRYRKLNQRVFDTDLISPDDAHNIARLLSERFTILKETMRLPAGIDTAGFELLDNIWATLTVNGRFFSGSKNYIITEINPAQDILTLEEREIFDISGEFPDTVFYDYDFDNMYPQTTKFECVLEGGGV
jgi:hypothetical protein